MNKEVRSMVENVEFRDKDNGDRFIEGYALKFNKSSQDLGGFKETITKEALDKTDLSDVRALFNHNADHVLARSSAGTLQLDVDDVGLKFRAKIPNTTYGNDLSENLRNGNVNQCSFGFCLDENGDDFTYDDKEGIFKRTLRSIKEIVDVSVVTYPAYLDTNAAPALRSLNAIKEEQRQKEVEEREAAVKHERDKEKLKIELELL